MKTNCSAPTQLAFVKTACGLFLALLLMALPLAASSQTIRDIATDATDPFNLADTEPSIAVDPSNPLRIAIVSFSEPWGPGSGAPVWMSTDGGLTWGKVSIIPQPGAGLGGPGDQKLAFDAAGRLLIAELGIAGSPLDFIYRQTGAPGTPLTAGASYGDDQPHLDVDKTPGSPCFNRVYSPWLNTFASPNRSNVEVSPDFGATVTAVIVGSPAFNNRTTRVGVATTGQAYIIYKTREGGAGGGFENAHFRVMRTDDCGANWTALGPTGVSVHGAAAVQTWFTTSWGNPAKGKVARARSSDGWVAVDPSDGDVYAAFTNRDGSGFGQIFVARSTDQGATWATHRVTDGTHHSAYPEVAVAGNGTVGVLYIDFDDSGPSTIFRHRFARSFDNGVTWTDKNLQSMDPGPLSNASSGFLWGDYEGLTAAGNTFFGVFTGASIGRTTPQLDPIFFSATAVPPAHIQVPTNVVFGDVCTGGIGRATLNVCSTGSPSLSVNAIISSNPQFAVSTPSGGFPVVISPGACFPFEVTFTPSGSGPQTAVLTIASDDAATPSLAVQASAQGGAGALGLSANLRYVPTVIQSIGACHAPLPLVVSNTGTCNLTITNMAIGGSHPGDFAFAGLPAFPITLEAGHIAGAGNLNVVFAPTALARERTANIAVTFVSNPTTGTTSTQTRELCGEGVHTGARVLVTRGGVPVPQVHEIELKRLWGLFGLTREVDEVKNVALQTVAASPGSACGPLQFHHEYGAGANATQLRPGVYQLKVEVKIAGKEERKTVWFSVDTCGFNGTLVVDF
ncbi:MAG TPA: choice-of-anchor D domain-containing protein [Blastocatellia bacterium]|nr:choice-of-anchor D domain-containing protein [Blastocatellia bacterium]